MNLNSEPGITKAVADGVDRLIALAHFAFARRIGFIIRKVCIGIQRVYLISHDLADSGIDGGNAFDRSSVIIDRLARAGDGLTRSCRSQKEQAVFAADHHLVVLPDDHLSGKIILRGHDIESKIGRASCREE